MQNTLTGGTHRHRQSNTGLGTRGGTVHASAGPGAVTGHPGSVFRVANLSVLCTKSAQKTSGGTIMEHTKPNSGVGDAAGFYPTRSAWYVQSAGRPTSGGE